MTMIKINRAGQALPKVEKLSLESIQYTLDLSEILLKVEQATGEVEILTELPIEDKGTKMGKNIAVRIGSNDIGTATYVDYPVTALFNTSQGNKKAAQFIVRVYK